MNGTSPNNPDEHNATLIESLADNWRRVPVDAVSAALADYSDLLEVNANQWLVGEVSEDMQVCWLERLLSSSNASPLSRLIRAAVVTCASSTSLIHMANGRPLEVPDPQLRALLALRAQCWEAHSAKGSVRGCTLTPQELHGVAAKKAREVSGMAACVEAVMRLAALPAEQRALVVDVGAGQGDLVAVLAVRGHRAVAVDRDDVQTHGSVRKRASKAAAFGVCNVDLRAETRPSELHSAATHGWCAAAGGDGVKSLTSAVSDGPVLLCSLHACGALSDNLLRLAGRWNASAGTDSAAGASCCGVVNLGCCYNLLAPGAGQRIAHQARGTKPEVDHLSEQAGCGHSVGPGPSVSSNPTHDAFPTSAGVRRVDAARRLRLTRSKLMAACQSPRTWYDAEVFTPLVERSVAQRVMVAVAGGGDVPDRLQATRGRGEKQDDPATACAARYAQAIVDASAEADIVGTRPSKAHRTEGEPPDPLSQVALMLEAAYNDARSRGLLHAFAAAWTLRGILGELLELLLLVDRCHAVHDAAAAATTADGRFRVALVPVVDVSVTPRNLAVVGYARRDPES
jgi:hypothetical protein